MKLRAIWKSLYKKIYGNINPVACCRKLGAKIGEHSMVKPSMLGGEPWLITIGDHVLLAGGVKLLTHDGAGFCLEYQSEQKLNMDMWGEVTIGNNVYVGTNAMILPNVHITDNVIIGAGAVVSKDITEDGVYVGVPARRVKSFEEWKAKASQKVQNTYGMTEAERRAYFDKILNRESKS